uniref:phosphoglycerate dehydrogenase n=1 Tax=Aureoumbra lagunensis TaxID=44058 RepID=A0A7S3JZP7_9STRA|mmetsp:Transcript_11607/g.17324  ORF Transcript_11607/g.17324 Transcript_11607/m.17324 type:complete len:475 (-) Transcript_11607:452-1876(-)
MFQKRLLSSGLKDGPHRFVIKTFNKISPLGLARFPENKYTVAPAAAHPELAHAILLRSHKLLESDVPLACRAIARCGAGTNNCNVEKMTEYGIPVFNTPGANANAVKELVVCALLLASRGILEGANHMKDLHQQGTAKERIEKDKALFGGQELVNKTLGVVGLGAIGAAITQAAISLGMNVIGYDPTLSVHAALRLPSSQSDNKFRVLTDLDQVCARCDYLTLHAPYIKDVTHHLIGEKQLIQMKPGASILNFAREELVDTKALADRYDYFMSTNTLAKQNGEKETKIGKYICDFALPDTLWKRPNVISIPHLGASTAEAEENAASMAADTIKNFLETGTIVNSVNFPTAQLPNRDDASTRVCIVNENNPGMLGKIMSIFGDAQINILQHINASRGNIAYNVIDIATPNAESDDLSTFNFKSWDALQLALTSIPDVKSTRLILDTPGVGYAINVNNNIFGVGGNAQGKLTFAEV